MKRVPVGDWTDLVAPRRYVSIEVVDGFGHSMSVMIPVDDADSYWNNVYRIAAWLGFGDGGRDDA